MTNTKFVIKVSRPGALSCQYVQRLDRTPVLMTLDRKRALMMGKLTAEEAVGTIQNSRRTAEIVPVAIRQRAATA